MLFRSAWVALFFLFISLCSCHDNIQPDKEADTGLLKGDTAERTLVIYMMAENTLENFVVRHFFISTLCLILAERKIILLTFKNVSKNILISTIHF